MTILILSHKADVHANDVEKSLLNKGQSVMRIDTDTWFEDGVGISLKHPGESYLEVKGTVVNMRTIHSVLYRRPKIISPVVKDENQKKFAVGEINELFHQLWYALSHAFWVNSPHALEFARRKFPQLQVAASAGFLVPRTCTSNSPTEIRDFCSTCKKTVYKTMKTPVIDLCGTGVQWGIPTTVVTSNLLDNLDLIISTGGIFQEYIQKSYEVRVTIIGSDTFAAKIDSQSTTEHNSHIDWRDGVVYGSVSVNPYTLPGHVKAACIQIVRHYGLWFGAMDLIRAPDGSYVFLELNPNGQWLWVEDMSGQPLLASMTNLLSKRVA